MQLCFLRSNINGQIDEHIQTLVGSKTVMECSWVVSECDSYYCCAQTLVLHHVSNKQVTKRESSIKSAGHKPN